MKETTTSDFYSLTCELYPETLVSNLINESRFLNDVSLVADDQSYQVFQANRAILSSCSDVLKDVLLHSSDPHPRVFLQGICSEDIRILLDFVYSGVVNAGQDAMDRFVDVRKHLQFKDIPENIQNVQNSKPFDILLGIKKQDKTHKRDRIEEVSVATKIKDDKTEAYGMKLDYLNNSMEKEESVENLETIFTEIDTTATVHDSLQCPACSFQTVEGMKIINRHIKEEHGSKCIFCTKDFPGRIGDLKRHIKTHNICSFCNKDFPGRIGDLKRHIYFCHNRHDKNIAADNKVVKEDPDKGQGMRPKTPQTHKSYPTYPTMKPEIKKQDFKKDEPVKCPECDYQVAHKVFLTSHIESKHYKLYREIFILRTAIL